MASRILVPVDSSDRSIDALEFALEEYRDADITAFHVIDPADFYSATGMEGGSMANYDQIRRHNEEQAEKILEDAADIASAYDVEIQTEYDIGDVSRVVVNYAAENDIDQIIIGSHGRTGARRILLGSIAESVARRSPVPVTIVR